MPILGSTATTNNTWTYNVKDYGAVGDNSHDDTTAIQAAMNALKATTGSVSGSAGGQQLFFPPGFYKTTAKLDFTGLAEVHIKGYSGRGGWHAPDSNPPVCINYAGGGTTTAVDMGGSQGCVWDGVSIWANPVAYSGVLLNLDSLSGDIYGHRVQNCQLRAISGTSAVLVSMAGNIECSFDNVTFADAGATGTQVRMVNLSAPAHWSNANSFRSCSFIGPRRYSILDPAHQTTLVDCTFEPSSGGIPAPIAINNLGNEPASGLTLIGCGFWDSTGATGSWLTSTVATDSFAIIGGTMSSSTAGPFISLSNHTGLSIQAVRFDATGGGTPNVFAAGQNITNASMLGCTVKSPGVDNHASVFV